MDRLTELFDKVRAALNLAEHPNTSPEEATAARLAADRMMAKYSIDEAAVRAARGETSTEKITIGSVKVTGAHANAQVTLAWSLDKVFSCKSVVHSYGYNKHLSVMGYESQVEAWTKAWAMLVLQRNSMLLTARRRGEHKQTWDADKGFNRSFILAYNSRVGRRMIEARRHLQEEMAPEGSSTAIALRDELQQVMDEFNKRWPKLGTSSAAPGSSAAGYRSGRDAGDRANIGSGPSLRGGRRALTA